MLPPSPTTVLVFGIVALGGVVTGVNGFGYSVVGTGLLAMVVEPQAAVVLMILPILGANVSLVRELDGAGVKRCAKRFWPFVATALVGTVVGMSLLPRVPRRPLTLALGLFVFGFLAYAQERYPLPGESWIRGRVSETTRVKLLLGAVSGLVFGASNVGVQVVAYLQSLELDHRTFVGVVAMVFLGISGVRVVVAGALGLYEDGGLLALSAVAAVPGLVGVSVGRRVRPRLARRVRRAGMFALLAFVGARLVTTGLGL
ncbi:hypothetical protein C2R22_14185 [Salinigranum rubrum]|uniref:Probable membrane transporter protein n=1 Tax=Salinigranum rubrum TaxID=755307 RepID=A0A2I8VL40_9EURY|nr:sulfite exporter TauE/SafE family protein [Salinigranum rubrum]AUV82647.1 hypothetical protein C2R22_14185 [Salinigranum rubrum]